MRVAAAGCFFFFLCVYAPFHLLILINYESKEMCVRAQFFYVRNVLFSLTFWAPMLEIQMK